MRFVAVLLLALAWAPPLIAGEARAVVELFTSQGCSSCPPADEMLGELAREPDVIAVTLPVTYWDYLGWKDTLAEKAFSVRQRGYAEVRGDGHVFTPQVVVNGMSAVLGHDRQGIEASIRRNRAARHALSVPVRLEETEGYVRVGVDAAVDRSRQGVIWLLPVAKERDVTISRGENKGRSVTYTNVVRQFIKLGEWSGEPVTLDVPLPIARPPGADGYVVLVQATRDGRPDVILGAAKGQGL